ncbi:MAG: hypothetical protein A2284_05675 [Deltaproteobacteria bacterium RIFOXYA12_FULL_61_11]|nr:MAG: hypothetical protein A2284_05675 [Deltaproteobacteria bacterium RIFOXYA12_FULL_61_11]
MTLEALKQLAESLPYLDKLQARDYLNDLIRSDEEASKDAPLSGQEKRRSRRFEVDISATGMVLRESIQTNAKRFNTKILDLSREGVRFLTRQAIAMRELCILSFRHQQLGFKKIYVEILRIKEQQKGQDTMYEYGGIAVDEGRVELYLVSLERGKLLDQRISSRSRFTVLAYVHSSYKQAITSLEREGFTVRSVDSRQRILKELMDTSCDLAILDVDLIGPELDKLVTSLKRFRQDLMVFAVCGNPETQKEVLDQKGIYEVLHRKTSQFELGYKIDKALRHVIMSDWNFLTKTKLRMLVFCGDDPTAARIDEHLHSMRCFTLVHRADRPVAEFIRDRGVGEFDFFCFDVQRFLKNDFVKLSTLLETLSIPTIAFDVDDHRKKVALGYHFDQFVQLPLSGVLLEELLRAAYVSKMWRNR